MEKRIITISREFGSGGRTIGKLASWWQSIWASGATTPN